MKFTITPLGGAGRGVTAIVDAIVRYLQPRSTPAEPLAGSPPAPAGDTQDSPGGYYADSGEEPGRWLGAGATALGLSGEVRREDFGRVLAGRDPRTGERLISAQGSAGRRPKLGVGTVTRTGPGGDPLFDQRDAAAVLGLPVKQVRRMLDAGSVVALSGLLPAMAVRQPAASYLVPLVDGAGNRWVTGAELDRCEDALHAGPSPEAVMDAGQPGDALPLPEAARLAGVTPRYLRRLAQRYHDDPSVAGGAAAAAGGSSRRAYLVARKDPKGRWQVHREDLVAYVRRRRPPAVRVGYDLTLTTEKSLAILGLLGGGTVRPTVLGAIEAGNDWALGWLEQHAAAARAGGSGGYGRGGCR